MAFAATALQVIESWPSHKRRPIGRRFNKGLAQEFGTEVAPACPAGMPTAFNDGRDATETGERGGGGKALALGAEGGEQAWGKNLARARQGSKERSVGMRGKESFDFLFVLGNGVQRGLQLRHEGAHEQGARGDHGRIGH